ncbi:hypothetical protein JYU34_008863 [Plutella xylostella]|uniref:Ig-like domain-containing protein n=1 Tax=Plutella xylostella TaxID=51655 RepID=A0ABQ7QN30_PLUXY|nr:hypothetical protein JYU34_008863 [Plutella xylostella]
MVARKISDAIASGICAVVLLCLVRGTTTLSLTGFSVPAAAPLGSDVRLRCAYSLATNEAEGAVIIKWWWRSLQNSSDTRQLYQRIGHNKPQAIRHNTNIDETERDTVELSGVQPSESGQYECEVATLSGAEVRQHATMQVYTEGTGPVLNVSLVDDGADADEAPDALVECSAAAAAPRPELLLTVNGQELKTEESLNKSKDGFFDITASARVSQADVAGAELRCELTFTDDSVSHPPYTADMVFQTSPEETTTSEPDSLTEPTTDAAATSEQRSNLEETPATDAAFWHYAVSPLLLIAVAMLI